MCNDNMAYLKKKYNNKDCHDKYQTFTRNNEIKTNDEMKIKY